MTAAKVTWVFDRLSHAVDSIDDSLVAGFVVGLLPSGVIMRIGGQVERNIISAFGRNTPERILDDWIIGAASRGRQQCRSRDSGR